MSTPCVETYRFGYLVVDGRSYDQDVIILPDGVLGGWWRDEGHALYPDDLEAVFEAAPDLLVVGRGAYGWMQITAETQAALQAAGIELLALPTEEACQAYNAWRGRRAVAAALHLSC
jgi:hypothetical protein